MIAPFTQQMIQCADHPYRDWSSFGVGMLGTVAGLLGLFYGYRQSKSAKTAERAEARVRNQLHKVMAMQRVSTVADQIGLLNGALRAREREDSRDQFASLLPLFAHLQEYVKISLDSSQAKAMSEIQDRLDQISPNLKGIGEIQDEDFIAAQEHCIQALKAAKRLHGSLEQQTTFELVTS